MDFFYKQVDKNKIHRNMKKLYIYEFSIKVVPFWEV